MTSKPIDYSLDKPQNHFLHVHSTSVILSWACVYMILRASVFNEFFFQLELAFQYASKSGHYKLARQISSLKDQRTMDASSDEGSDPVIDYPRHTYTRDSTLSSTRSHHLPISSATKTSSSRSTSHPLIKRSSSHHATSSYIDDNMSDNCSDGMDTIVKENDDGEGRESGEEEEGEDRENTSLNSNTVDLFSSPQPSAASLTIKNNPFKVPNTIEML